MADTHYISTATEIAPGAILFENRYRNFSCPLHFHETYQVEIISKGKKSSYCNGTNLNGLGAGTILLVNPGETHTGGSDGEEELVCTAFYPRVETWASIIGDSFPGLQKIRTEEIYFKTNVINDQRIKTYSDQLNRIAGDADQLLRAEGLYQQIMVELLKNYSMDHIVLDENHRYYAAALDRGTEYIQDNIAEKLLLDEIARAAFVSPFHFLRIFKDHKGMTLHQYILSLRIEKAKSLLGNPKNSIAYVFSRVGFSDQTHFTKVFKKITGLTPKQYRDVVRN